MVAHTLPLLLSLAAQFSGEDLQVGTQPGTLNTPLAKNADCTLCHGDAGDPRAANNTYHGTMMQLAGLDPVFLASLEIAYNDVPVAAQLCIRCHFPAAWLQGRGQGTPSDNFGLTPEDMVEGVGCDFCHRMETPEPIAGATGPVPPPELSGVVISNAQVFVSDGRDKVGPFETNRTNGHASSYSQLITDSVMCAQCHDVSNTFVERKDLNGNPMGAVMPIERTYSEWASSVFANAAVPPTKGCQDCHMERYTGYAASAGFPEQREGLNDHTLVGGNAIAPPMVAYLSDTVTNAQATRVAEAAAANLRDAAELAATELVVDEAGPRLRVRVTNLAGHKLPTGYSEGRRMFISHAVTRADGVATPIHTGEIDGATGRFIDGREPVRKWEITLAGPGETGNSFHFATVDRISKDNRIPPQGFTPREDTAPVGQFYEMNPDGTLVNYDEVELPLGDFNCWPAVVSVDLNFQAVSGKYKEFLVENAPLYGPDLLDAWNATGAANPVQMEHLEVTVYPNGRIFVGAGVFACEPGPVYNAPEPDPAPSASPEPAVTPAPEPAPSPEPTSPGQPPPDPYADQPGLLCTCATAPERAPLALALLFGAAAMGLTRRRRTR